MYLQKMVLIPGNSLPLRTPKGHESIEAQGLPWVFCFMHRALKGAPEPELDPLKIRAEYDAGDHLHPNDAGYKAMGDSVDLKLLGGH